MLKEFIRQSSPNIDIEIMRMIIEAGCFQSLVKIFIIVATKNVIRPIVWTIVESHS